MPERNTDDTSKQFPTTRTIASYVGVSNATVSMALRNHPLISAAMRKKVQLAAAKLGYRPDPEIAKLMHHLRMRNRPRYKSNIAALTTLSESAELPYTKTLWQSAQRRAEALGYGLSLLRLDAATKGKSLQRILVARGVQGLLLLPMAKPESVAELLDWGDFSVVAMTNSIQAPDFHRVVPHQFGNTLLLCQTLTNRGYRRVGLVMEQTLDQAVNHGFSAPVTWHNVFGGTESVTPLLFEGNSPAGLKSWFNRERPDAIVVSGERMAHEVVRLLGLKIPGPIAIAAAEWAGPMIFAGINQRPAAIGTTAVDLLHPKIQTGEKGVPEIPGVLMLKGVWVEGKSVRDSVVA